ncbi:hypothetical protein AAZV13_14G108400 [Glycine max]
MLHNCEISISPNFTEVEGRVLQAPRGSHLPLLCCLLSNLFVAVERLHLFSRGVSVSDMQEAQQPCGIKNLLSGISIYCLYILALTGKDMVVYLFKSFFFCFKCIMVLLYYG